MCRKHKYLAQNSGGKSGRNTPEVRHNTPKTTLYGVFACTCASLTDGRPCGVFLQFCSFTHRRVFEDDLLGYLELLRRHEHNGYHLIKPKAKTKDSVSSVLKQALFESPLRGAQYIRSLRVTHRRTNGRTCKLGHEQKRINQTPADISIKRLSGSHSLAVD